MSEPEKNRTAERWNYVVVAAMGGLWFAPMAQFWGAAFGPMRPYSYGPVVEKASGPWFLAALALSFVPLVLPRGCYSCREGARGMRIYRALGVRWLRRFVTNGDIINRLTRRVDPAYRLVRDAESARAWAARTDEGEKWHLIFLLMGIFTALYAARLGWYGWAFWLTVSNVVFNLYPVLLQRYNRCRIERLLSRA